MMTLRAEWPAVDMAIALAWLVEKRFAFFQVRVRFSVTGKRSEFLNARGYSKRYILLGWRIYNERIIFSSLYWRNKKDFSFYTRELCKKIASSESSMPFAASWSSYLESEKQLRLSRAWEAILPLSELVLTCAHFELEKQLFVLRAWVAMCFGLE